MKEDRCETKGREGSEHGQVDKEGPGLQGVHWLQCKDINGDHLWKSLQWSSRSETRWPLVTVTGGEYREVARVDMSPKQHCQPSQPALAVLQCQETRGLHLLAPSCPYSRMVHFVILFSFFFKFQGFLGLQGGGGGRGGYFFVCSFVVVLFYIDILGE